jgi:fatty acid desaturase
VTEPVIVSSPLSFTGSARRLWRPVRRATTPAAKVGLGTLVVFALLLVWTFIVCWYLLWGLWVVPWRLLRRGQRRQKAYDRALAQHRPSNEAPPWR